MNLGSAQRYFCFSSALLPLFPFIIYLMRKEYCYLPNLNSLFLQNSNYQKHRYNVKRSKSTFEHTRDLGVCSKEVQELHRQVLELKAKKNQTLVFDRPETPIYKLKQSSNGKVKSETGSPSVLKFSGANLTPYEKRKLSERNQENLRMCKALQYSNPVIMSTRSPKSIALQQSLKERASKFSREGNMIVYKFKKSLADIARRKKEHKKILEVSHEMQDELKKQLMAINEKRCKTQLQGKICGDIYVHDLGTKLKYNLYKQQGSETDIEAKNSIPSRTIVCESVLNSKKRSSKLQHCNTDPNDVSLIMYRVKKYLKKHENSIEVKANASKEQLSPKHSLMLNKSRRKDINGMQIVRLPQIH